MANTRKKTTVSNNTAAESNGQTSVVKKELPLNMMVACTNLTMGKLVYVSKKQVGYHVVWENL